MTRTRAFTSSGSGPVSKTDDDDDTEEVVSLRRRRLDFVRLVRVDEADNEVLHARLATDDPVGDFQERLDGRREVHHVILHLVEAVLNPLCDLDLTLACQQLDRSHFPHVHADRVGRAAKLGVDAREGGFGFLGSVIVRRSGVRQGNRLDVGHLLVHGDTHVVDHVDDVFDLFRVDDVVRQVVVDLRIGQVTLFLAAGNQFLQLLSLCAAADCCSFLRQDKIPASIKYKRLILLFCKSSIYKIRYCFGPDVSALSSLFSSSVNPVSLCFSILSLIYCSKNLGLA